MCAAIAACSDCFALPGHCSGCFACFACTTVTVQTRAGHDHPLQVVICCMFPAFCPIFCDSAWWPILLSPFAFQHRRLGRSHTTSSLTPACAIHDKAQLMSESDEPCRTKTFEHQCPMHTLASCSGVAKKQRQQEKLDLLLSKFDPVLAHFVEIALANRSASGQEIGPIRACDIPRCSEAQLRQLHALLVAQGEHDKVKLSTAKCSSAQHHSAAQRSQHTVIQVPYGGCGVPVCTLNLSLCEKITAQHSTAYTHCSKCCQWSLSQVHFSFGYFSKHM